MKHQPERTCIGCRTARNKDEVVRIIAGPDGIVIDYREKLNGRAAYVCPKRECIAKALTREALAAALRRKVPLPDAETFVSLLCARITEKIKSLIAVSIKAGKTAAGYSAVRDALEKGRVELLLFAHDQAGGTREKLSMAGSGLIRQETFLTRDELGAIAGRELVGVIAILDKGLADALWNETQRLKNLINVDE